MRDYFRIYQLAVHTVERDYVGKEAAGRAVAEAHKAPLVDSQLHNTIWDKTLLTALRRYLASFRDRSLRLLFSDPSSPCRPFSRGLRTRRQGDRLYVEGAAAESGLLPGDEILGIDSFPLSAYRRDLGPALYGDREDRELWEGILEDAYRVSFLRGGRLTQGFALKKLPLPPAHTAPRAGKLDGDIFCLSIPDFQDDEELEGFLSQRRRDIAAAKALVIDLRCNRKGLEGGYYPLLPFLFPEPTPISSLMPRARAETLYNAENVRRMIRQLSLYQADLGDGEARRALEAEMERLENMAGRGYVLEPLPPSPDTIEPLPSPDRVVILSDLFTEGAAEELLLMARNSPKVTLVGRPSMGALGRGSEIVHPLDESGAFTLIYPARRLRYEDPEEDFFQRGIPVDIPVPWTPPCPGRDPELEAALAFLR